MNSNMNIYDASRQVPPEALKPINGGRLKGMSDINPMWRIKKLTELFGICGIGWKIEITDKRLEQGSSNEIVCFVDINLYVKVEGEWSAPIPGMGGSSFVTMEKSGPYTSDECFKMAYTDAISVACKSLGFAADVYYANDRTKYTDKQDKPYGAPSKPVETQQKPDAQTGKQQTGQQQPSKTAALNHKSKTINAMNEMKWDWNTLGAFASEALGRKIGKVLQDIKTEEEWKTVADALETTMAAQV